MTNCHKKGAEMNTLSIKRDEKQLSQEELARKIGVSTSTISMWESGKRTPPLKKAKKLADFFNVKIEDIFFDI